MPSRFSLCLSARRSHSMETGGGFECLREEILKEGARAAAAQRWGGVDVEDSGSSPLSAKDRWISAQEVSHMESPEADEAHRRRVSRTIDELFSKIPLPEDPMAAALAPNAEEEQENAAAEMLKEAVREAYWRRVNARRAEEARVEKAMQRRFPGLAHSSSLSPSSSISSAPIPSPQTRTDPDTAAAVTRAGKAHPTGESSEEQLRLELEAMKARVRELETQLGERK